MVRCLVVAGRTLHALLCICLRVGCSTCRRAGQGYTELWYAPQQVARDLPTMQPSFVPRSEGRMLSVWLPCRQAAPLYVRIAFSVWADVFVFRLSFVDVQRLSCVRWCAVSNAFCSIAHGCPAPAFAGTLFVSFPHDCSHRLTCVCVCVVVVGPGSSCRRVG
jgi:hypothetical protein